jgi:hypothetical protein
LEERELKSLGEEKAMQIQKEYSDELAQLVRGLFNQWKYPVIIVYGNPDTGKTDAALLLVEIAMDLGVLEHFASNIETYDRGEKITSLEEVDYWFKHQSGTKCYILDEAGVHDDSRSPLSRMNREIRHEIFVIRKFHGHVIFVLQELEDLDKWKHSELTGAFIKKRTWGNEFIAQIKTRFHEDLFIFRDIPRTTTLFNTLDIAMFTLERQIDEAKVSLKGLPYRVAQLYGMTGNMSFVAKELEKDTGKLLKHMQIKRFLQQFCKEQLRIPEKKRGRPRKLKPLE